MAPCLNILVNKIANYSIKNTHLELEITTVTDKSNIFFSHKYGWYVAKAI